MTRFAPSILFALAASLLAAACGGSGDGGDHLPACPSGNCGKPSFRKAIPTRADMLVPFGNARARIAGAAVGAESEAFAATADHVDEINATIDDLFEDLETLAGTTPEIEEDTVHQWRTGEGGLDIVLRLESSDEIQFQLSYYVGATGFEPAPGDQVATSTITTDDDGLADLTLDLDFDALTAIVPEVDTRGLLQVRYQPFGDEHEIWYDMRGFAEGAEEAVDSLTTYWAFADGSGGLEFLADFEGGDAATAYVRWDDAGGRYDHHVFLDGAIDQLVTSCWSAGGVEEFGAWVELEGDEVLDGEIDGDESACDFGPVADHPNPGSDFDDLPAEGEWDDLVDGL